jgi:signal transduction histidine kinase
VIQWFYIHSIRQRYAPLRNANSGRSTRDRQTQLLVGRFEEEAEQQRRQIARQLHDDIGQDLTLLVFLLDQIKRSLGKGPSEELAQAQEIAAELIAKVRDISLLVRPAIPEAIGLLPTLETFLQGLADSDGTQPYFRHSGLDRELPTHIATATYLITRKAVGCLNGGGRRLRIAIRVAPRSVTISVTSSGAVTEAVRYSDEIKWIRDRAEYLGGTFDLSSPVEAAARLTVRLPLFKTAAAEAQS